MGYFLINEDNSITLVNFSLIEDKFIMYISSSGDILLQLPNEDVKEDDYHKIIDVDENGNTKDQRFYNQVIASGMNKKKYHYLPNIGYLPVADM